MDAGVVSDCRPQAFATRTAAERFCYRSGPGNPLKILGCRSQRDRRSRKSCRSSPMRRGIAFVAAPGIRPRGTRNARRHHFSAAC